jgi:hypothetical protein
MMDTKADRLILREIEEMWRIHCGERPWGMWVTRHLPVSAGAEEVDYETPLRVWFLDEIGLRPRDYWTYCRFHTVHFLQPWCSGKLREQDGIFGEDRYPIGMACFAPYIGNEDIYLEVDYGKLFGRGYRLTIVGDEVVSEGDLWRS